MFFLVAIAVLLVLPDPWNFFAFAASLVAGIGEVAFWNRRVKHGRVAAGAETLIGTTGKVLSRLAPDGQIELSGEIWNARCASGAEVGEAVTVVGREGLTLIVEPTRVDDVDGRDNHARADPRSPLPG
jgi:membrane protein implicated in regulation of membrane protease activity